MLNPTLYAVKRFGANQADDGEKEDLRNRISGDYNTFILRHIAVKSLAGLTQKNNDGTTTEK